MDLLSELRAAWPGTAWDSTQADALAARGDPAALDGPHRADLLWVGACLARDPAALAALAEGPIVAARDHLRALGFAPAAIDDAVQRGLLRLALDNRAGTAPTEPGLAAYRGRGPLAMFVRTAIVRMAIDDQRKEPPVSDLGDLLASPSPDPELEYMRVLYADHLAAAVREAWTHLAAHERFVLSLRIYEAMTVDDLARVYGIHRASAARRAAAARAALITATRAALRARLAVGDSTLDSILRVVSTSVQLPLDDVPGAEHER